VIESLKIKNYPIDTKEFYLRVNSNQNLNKEKLNIDYYKNKIENEFNGNRKEFLQSILDKSNQIKFDENSLLKEKGEFANPFIKYPYKSNPIINTYFETFKYQIDYKPKENPIFKKEFEKIKFRNELQGRSNKNSSSFLNNKNKNVEFLKEYYYKIRDKMILIHENDFNIYNKIQSNDNINDKITENYELCLYDDIISKKLFTKTSKRDNITNNIKDLQYNLEPKNNRSPYYCDLRINNNNNFYNNSFLKVITSKQFPINLINISSNDIDEEKKIIRLYKYNTNDIIYNFINSENLTLIRIKVTEFKKFEEMLFLNIINSNLDYELLTNLFIMQIKKLSIFTDVPDDLFKSYIGNFLFIDQLISEKNFHKVFEKDHTRYLIDEKIGEMTFKYFEFIFSIDYDRIIADYLIYYKK